MLQALKYLASGVLGQAHCCLEQWVGVLEWGKGRTMKMQPMCSVESNSP